MESLDNWHYLPHLQLFTVALFFFAYCIGTGPNQPSPNQSEQPKPEPSPLSVVKSPSHQRALNTKADQRGPSFGKYETKQENGETDFVQWNVIYTK